MLADYLVVTFMNFRKVTIELKVVSSLFPKGCTNETEEQIRLAISFTLCNLMLKVHPYTGKLIRLKG